MGTLPDASFEEHPVKKLSLLAVMALLLGFLAGCGDDSSGGSDDGDAKGASVEEFCGVFLDMAQTAQEQGCRRLRRRRRQAPQGPRRQAGRGRHPDDMPEDAQNGLELLIGKIKDLPDDAHGRGPRRRSRRTSPTRTRPTRKRCRPTSPRSASHHARPPATGPPRSSPPSDASTPGPSRAGGVVGRCYFSSRDRRRSARGLPPVWQVGQYCRLRVGEATPRARCRRRPGTSRRCGRARRDGTSSRP